MQDFDLEARTIRISAESDRSEVVDDSDRVCPLYRTIETVISEGFRNGKWRFRILGLPIHAA
jgi:hypothetical protein